MTYLTFEKHVGDPIIPMQEYRILIHAPVHLLKEVVQLFTKPPQVFCSLRVHPRVHSLPDLLQPVRNHFDKRKRPREHSEQVRYVFGEFCQKIWSLVSHRERDGVKMPEGCENQAGVGVWEDQAAIPDQVA